MLPGQADASALGSDCVLGIELVAESLRDRIQNALAQISQMIIVFADGPAVARSIDVFFGSTTAP
jgi:hypothetical protein